MEEPTRARGLGSVVSRTGSTLSAVSSGSRVRLVRAPGSGQKSRVGRPKRVSVDAKGCRGRRDREALRREGSKRPIHHATTAWYSWISPPRRSEEHTSELQ